jgi:nicotinate-nucleotide adenylyltransferase
MISQNKLDIAIIGGAFDPVGLNHEEMAQVVIANTGMNVWFMPCYKHLFGKQPIDEIHRLNMLAYACWASIQMGYTNWEIRMKHTGSTYESMQGLKKEYSDYNFYLVIGMDNANVIEQKWDRGDKLIQEFPFIVFERQGIKPQTDWFQKEPHRVFAINNDISSTMIRDAIELGDYQKAQRYLNPRVWSHIVKHKLYGYKGPDS